MSRLKNFSRNLTTTYLSLGANTVYNLLAVRLVWNWLPLPEAELGMWALLGQMLTYIAMVDMGMTGAAGRLLVDHKDDRASGTYGSMIKTVFMVSLAQAACIAAITSLAAPLLATLMQHKIPAGHVPMFITLIRAQGLITAFSFSFRAFNLMLYANQRMDIQASSDIITLAVSFILLASFLAKGCGIYSYLYANAFTALIGPSFLFWNCRRLGFLPRAGEWGLVTWKNFVEIFNFGKDIFLISLGYQLQMASQTIVVFNALGATQAAMWTVGSKMFSLMEPLMSRPYGAALPGFYEMVARGEMERLKARYRSIVLLTASWGAFLAASFVLCNNLFVHIWTSGKTEWSPVNDLLLGIWLVVLSMQTTHRTFVNVTKDIGGMRYMLFLEGFTFLVVALFTGRYWGIPGMVLTSIFCTLAFTYQYSIRRSCEFFRLPFYELAVNWLRPSLTLVCTLAVFVAAVWLMTGGLPVLVRLVVHAALAGTIGIWLFLRIGLERTMIEEALRRLPARFGGPVRRLVLGNG